jgi:uncharacterized membrane protein
MFRACCDRPARTFSILRGLFLIASVFLAVFFIAGFASGWISIRRNEHKNTATIEIDTGRMQTEANQAAQKGEQVLERGVDTLRDLGRAAERDSVPTSVHVQPSLVPTPSPTPPPATPPVTSTAPAETI